MKYFISIIISVMLLSCKQNYYSVLLDKKISNEYWIFDSIVKKVNPEKKDNFIIKIIEWNPDCKCGLIDITKNKKHFYNYSSILIFPNKSQMFLGDYNSNFEKVSSSEKIISDFKGQASNFFSEQEYLIIKKRLDKGTVHLRGSIIMGNLDIVRDSLLLDKYLYQNDTILHFSLRSKLAHNLH